RSFKGGDVLDRIFLAILDIESMCWLFSPCFYDLLIGIGLSIRVWGVMYSKKRHPKKFRHGVEYGSERC
ncbi:hypothetical protein ACJBQ9_11965, partial [Streptococcus suis]